MVEQFGLHAPRRRAGPGMIAILAVSALCFTLIGTLLAPPRPTLLWNASPSSPTGLYLVRPPDRLRVGDVVIARPPSPAARLAAARRYLPTGVPLVKPVGAVAGQRVCAKRKAVTVDGTLAAVRLGRDRLGRAMPWWRGCRRLGTGEIFLLSRASPAAFDGRYFGVTRSSDLVGKAVLLWAH